MLLTCPECRSGLEVPDGTAALVRCPACQTVFSPADGAPPDGEGEEYDEEPRPKRRRPRDEQEDDEDDRPRRRRARSRRREDEDDEGGNRGFDPPAEDDDRPRTRPRRDPNDGLSPEQRAARRAAFGRAAIGVKLIWASLGLFAASMMFFNFYFFQSAFTDPSNALIVFAGLFGLANWLLAAVGVGLCLSGPPSPGHWGYGSAAAASVVVHLILLLALLGQGRGFAVGRVPGEGGGVRWSLLPTQLNATMLYLTAIVYPDGPWYVYRGGLGLPMITGIAEMVRTVFMMMLLSCLARAALDEDLAGQCTRAAGVASAGPGVLAVLIFLFVMFTIETNAGGTTFAKVLSVTIQMGVYSILVGLMVPSYLAARDVADACDEPFQSLIPRL